MNHYFTRELSRGLGVGDVYLEGGAVPRIEEVRRFGERGWDRQWKPIGMGGVCGMDGYKVDGCVGQTGADGVTGDVNLVGCTGR